jgi:hypothetical protein
MERFAAESLKAERDAAIKAAIKNNTPWPDLMEVFGLSQAEIEKVIVDSVPGAKRQGSALIVETDNTPQRGRR